MKNDKTVLITGATSGIGKALAHQFAANSYNLILVGRYNDTLSKTKQELTSQYAIKIWNIEKDIAQDNAAQELYDDVIQSGHKVNILVNDAGIGQRGKFVNIPFTKYSEIIHLNILSLTHLTRLFLKDMVDRNEGKILQLGSIAGFQPGPLLAVYHASKAYVVSLSEAIATELNDMDSDVTITCLCPGPTDTNFFSRADMENTRVVDQKDKLMKQPDEVAKGAFKALMDGERLYIPGASNKILTFIRRAIPKSMQAKVQKQFYEQVEDQ